jgi:hypothetical protein
MNLGNMGERHTGDETGGQSGIFGTGQSNHERLDGYKDKVRMANVAGLPAGCHDLQWSKRLFAEPGLDAFRSENHRTSSFGVMTILGKRIRKSELDAGCGRE